MATDRDLASGAFAPASTAWQAANMRLAEIRKARGLSQAQLGEMIGKDAATISRAENVHSSAMLQTYVACAEALRVPLAEVLGLDVSPIERRLLDLFRSMSADRRAEMVALLEVTIGPPAKAE